MVVLIVKLSAFGDIVHSLPAIDDLLCRPEINKVHFLVDQRYAFATRVLPAGVQVHTVNVKSLRALTSIPMIVRKLRQMRFDAIIDLQGLIKSSLLARLVSPKVFGMDPEYCRERVSSFFTQPVRFHPDERHVVQQYRRVAVGPFMPDTRSVPSKPLPYKPPRVQLTNRMRAAGLDILGLLKVRKNQFVILHLGGGWATKILSDKTWLNVAHGILKDGLTPVFSWGNSSEEILAHRLEERVRNAVILPRRLDIYTLCGLLTNARAAIGADTGVLHLAAALGTNTATFWGPSASWRSGPAAGHHVHVEAGTDCGPCFQRNCNNFICMEKISADALLRVLHEQ